MVSAEAEDIFDSFVGHMGGRRQPDTFPTPDDWARLVAAAHEYRQARPWRRRADDEHLDLVVRVDGVAARYVAIVLGAEGVQRGLVLYPGGVFSAERQRGWRPGTPVEVPAGTVMFYLDPPEETPPEFVAKAARYGWPADADLVPAWVIGGPDGPADLDQTTVRRLTLAVTAVLAHDGQARAEAATTGVQVLADDSVGEYTIRPTA